MATGEDDLTRDVLNRAMDLYGRDQVLGAEQRDLSISDVREIADQLGVPQRYVTAALAQPMVRKPSKHQPTTYVAERYVTHSAADAKEAGLEYFRRREGMVPVHSVPFGCRLGETESYDFLGFIEDSELRLTTFKQVDFTVHKVDAHTSVIRLEASVTPVRHTMVAGASIGVVTTSTALCLAGLALGVPAIATLLLIVTGFLLGGAAGARIGLYLWQQWVDKLEHVLTQSLNGAADVLDNPLPPPTSPGQQLAEGAGKIIGAFVRGLGEQHKRK